MTNTNPQQPTAPQTPQPRHGQADQDRTNGFAIAGLIFSILGGWLGLVFSIIALVQIGRQGGKGKGLAIAGLVVSILWIAAAIGLAATGNLA